MMSIFTFGTRPMARHMRGLLAPCILAVAFGAVAPAFAQQDCGGDLQKLAEKRQAALTSINSLVAAAHGKQLDPSIFCARSQPLNAAETAMLAYMEKNKDWCQVPDDAIEQLKATHAKSVSFAAKACNVAAQMKKMKEQAAQQGAAGAAPAQPLPAGPL